MTWPRHKLLTILLPFVLTLSACAATPFHEVSASALQIDRIDSRAAHVAEVTTEQLDPSHLKVSGKLTKRLQTRGHIPGELHITALAANGTVLDHQVSSYHRRNPKSSHSYFSVTMQVAADDIHTIQITHYGLGTLTN